MCTGSGIIFVAEQLPRPAIAGKRIIELGAGEFGVRPLLQHFGPAEYVGVDIQPGPGVDVVMPAERVLDRFPDGSFDVVVSTEMVEHVRAWRAAFHAIKRLVKHGGRVVVTTRSRGYPFHGAPSDFWRYEPGDMRRIFADFDDVLVEPDPVKPGVFVAATRPAELREADLSSVELFAMPLQRRAQDIQDSDLRTWTAARARLDPALRRALGSSFDLFRDLLRR